MELPRICTGVIKIRIWPEGEKQVRRGEGRWRQSRVLGEPIEDGDCWLRDTALGDGFIKLLLRANVLRVDIKKKKIHQFHKVNWYLQIDRRRFLKEIELFLCLTLVKCKCISINWQTESGSKLKFLFTPKYGWMDEFDSSFLVLVCQVALHVIPFEYAISQPYQEHKGSPLNFENRKCTTNGGVKDTAPPTFIMLWY